MSVLPDKSMSSLWRKNASTDPAIDLVSILDGARILSQSLAPNTDVEYAGVKVAQTDRKKIFMSPKVLGDEHPVAGDKVDIFLGTTVHEIGHILFSADKRQYITDMHNIANSYRKQPYNNLRYLDKVIEIFEDIYVDSIMSGFPVYREYLKRSYTFSVGEFDADVVTTVLKSPCDRMDMLNALCYFTVLNGKPNIPDIEPKNLEILGALLNEATKMVAGKSPKDVCIFQAYKKLCELPEYIDHDNDPNFKQPPAPPQQQDDDKDNQGADSDVPGNDKQDKDADAGDKPGDNGDKKDEDKEDGEPDDDEKDSDEDGDEFEEDGEEPGDSEEDDEPGDLEKDGTDDGTDTQPGDGQDKPSEPTDDRPVWKPQDLVAGLDSLTDDKTPMSADLADKVSKAIIEKHDDLSQLISHLAGDSENKIITYTPPDDNTNANEARLSTAPIEERLRRVFQQYRLWKTKDYHGLREGRVSSGRLYRTSYGDDRVFKRREQPDTINMAICLLVDLSGSIQVSRELVYQVICSMCDAMQKEKVDFFAIGYSLDDAINPHEKVVSIPRLYDPETKKVMLSLTKEWGFTPSYEGIAAGIAQLLRFGDDKHKVLIHFTDGRPNSGNTEKIPELLTYARRHGISDIHICIPGNDPSSFRFSELYGVKNTREIKSITDLPDQIEKELRDKMKEE